MEMPEESQIFELLLKEGIDNFPILTKYTLDSKKVKKNTVVTPYTSFDLTLISKEFERKVYLRLVDYYTHQRFLVNIEHLQGHHNTLSVDDYLHKYCGMDSSTDVTLLDNYPGSSLQDKIGNHFRFLIQKIDKRFNSILEGADWVEIPFDWHGYR